jgi:hypothetical protein
MERGESFHFLQSAMFFKKRKNLIFLAAFLFIVSHLYSEREILVDRVIATVDDEVITLSDLKISIHFNLYPELNKREINKYLEKIINQKLVKLKIERNFTLEKEVLMEKKRLIKEFGSEENLIKELKKFGLNLSDLEKYIKEKLYFNKVIEERAQFIIPITLDEIEKYYNEKYVPEQKRKNLYPKSLLEVAAEIESKIARQKRERLISSWLQELKKDVNIEIKIQNLNFIIESEEGEKIK